MFFVAGHTTTTKHRPHFASQIQKYEFLCALCETLCNFLCG